MSAIAMAIPNLIPALAASPDVASGVDPGNLWRAWELDPAVIVGLTLSVVLYGRGIMRLWGRCGTGFGVTKAQAAAFSTGWLLLLIALVSPLHVLGESLFSAHMAQHEILMTLAAPLLVLGRPVVPFLMALPLSWRRSAGRLAKSRPWKDTWDFLSRPFVSWSFQALVFWIWHVPRFFDATLTSEWVHAAQHFCFLGSALLFWWTLIRGTGGRASYGAGTFYVFATAVYTGALGALLTFAPRVWYPAYGSTTAGWGLAPLEDQQLGGLLMWVVGGLIYMLAALALFGVWLRRDVKATAHVFDGGVFEPAEQSSAVFIRDSRRTAGGYGPSHGAEA